MNASPDLGLPETDDLHLVVGKLHLTLALPPELPAPASDQGHQLVIVLGSLHLNLELPNDS